MNPTFTLDGVAYPLTPLTFGHCHTQLTDRLAKVVTYLKAPKPDALGLPPNDIRQAMLEIVRVSTGVPPQKFNPLIEAMPPMAACTLLLDAMPQILTLSGLSAP